MRIFVFVLVAASSAALSSQTRATAPASHDQFQFPTALASRSALFKLQMPAMNLSPALTLQSRIDAPLPLAPIIRVQPRTVAPNPQIDEGIVKRPPNVFSIEPPRPATRQDLFPGLNIQPTEFATVTPLAALWADAKMIPIPTTFPNARFEPIPRNIEGFTAVQISASSADPSSRK